MPSDCGACPISIVHDGDGSTCSICGATAVRDGGQWVIVDE